MFYCESYFAIFNSCACEQAEGERQEGEREGSAKVGPKLSGHENVNSKHGSESENESDRERE